MILAKYLMLQGTASNVGKSIVTTAFCRIFKQDGYKVAPFKAQNMALNSFVTTKGGEMGRAQVVQAQAAGIEPDVIMNPVLLKPTGNATSQVVVLGKALDTMSATQYHNNYAQKVFTFVEQSLDVLDKEYEIVVIEGAGSPAEVNLKANDIVNMRVAKHLKAPVLLISDIDRGGALASIVGTMELLDEDERALVAGFLINKFRGDINLLTPALDFLHNKTGVEVLGVFDYLPDLGIDDEDSVVLDSKASDVDKKINIVVIRLPKISNFTDFSPLELEKDVAVRYAKSSDELDSADLIIIPGSKNTTEDLLFLKENKLDEKIISLKNKGVPVIGICGGYQMLGEMLFDPDETESNIKELKALGLLPATTVFAKEKLTRQVMAKASCNRFLGLNFTFDNLIGYEIHTGETSYVASVDTAFAVDRGDGVWADDGAISADGLVMGTYIHGIFDNDKLRRLIIDKLYELKGIEIGEQEQINVIELREKAYDRLADSVRARVDMDKIYKIMGLK